MLVKKRKILHLFFSIPFLIKELTGIAILSCGSNKIVNTTLDLVTQKYTIHFDSSAKVPLGAHDELKVWCESNIKYDACELQGETYNCSQSKPVRCDDDFSCKNNKLIRFEHLPNEPRKCAFSFTNPMITGTKCHM